MINAIDKTVTSGIYKIENTTNGKIYVGKSKQLHKRFGYYDRSIRNSNKTKQINEYLWRSFVLHGKQSFTFTLLEEVKDLTQLAQRELHWMEELNSCSKKHGYNLRMDSSSGYITHELTSKKISANLKKQWASGLRSQHSSKMKALWKDPTRQQNQRMVMVKVRTKYEYIINGKSLNYRQLCELGFGNVMSNFHRKKSNIVTHKSIVIERRLIKI